MASQLNRVLLTVLFVTIMGTSTAFGWGNGGHMAVAMRAWDVMTPAQRAGAVELIKQHPRYALDVVPNMPKDLSPADQDLWTFCFFATWPDYISQVRMRLIAPADYHKYPHSSWHYIELPVTLDPAQQPRFSTSQPTGDPAKFSVLYALPYEIDQLNDKKLPLADRSLALAWVMHMTGDLHEPCHSATLFSARYPAPGGDHVATRLKVQTAPGHTSGLHQFWDSLYCANDDLPSLKAWDASILADPALKPEALPQLQNDLTVESWVKESYQYAQHDVYDRSVRAGIAAQDATPATPWVPITLSEDYKANARTIGRRVGDLAGLRLANILAKVEWR